MDIRIVGFWSIVRCFVLLMCSLNDFNQCVLAAIQICQGCGGLIYVTGRPCESSCNISLDSWIVCIELVIYLSRFVLIVHWSFSVECILGGQRSLVKIQPNILSNIQRITAFTWIYRFNHRVDDVSLNWLINSMEIFWIVLYHWICLWSLRQTCVRAKRTWSWQRCDS